MAKYVGERSSGRKRSPLVHLGRALEVAGTAKTAADLQFGTVTDIYRTFGPAALGCAIGAMLEYGLGPIHERFSPKYK